MSKRRNLLKALSVVGGAAAVENWKKPVVNSISLPAHAATSCNGDCVDIGGGNSWQYTPGTFPFGSASTWVTSSECAGNPLVTFEVVEAADEAQAQERFQCTAVAQVVEITCAAIWSCNDD